MLDKSTYHVHQHNLVKLLLRNRVVIELILYCHVQVVTKHLSEEDGSGGENSALAAQVQRLTQELRYLASSPRNVTVVNGGSSTNYSSLILPAATIGIVGYGYIKWKGLKWTDFMYVTRKHMTNAVASVSKQLETVSTALQATKRQLTAKLEGVTKSLDDSMILQGLIRNQVTEVQSEVVRANGEIGEVQRLVLGLEGKIDEVQANQEIANQGIVLLCRYASQPPRLSPNSCPIIIKQLLMYGRLFLFQFFTLLPFLCAHYGGCAGL